MTAAILFDFNGVIVDDEPQHCEALIATLAEDGFALDRDTYYREYLGFDDRECFRFSYARMGRPTDEPALLRQAPNNWNLGVTYDHGELSARMGLSHNDASIFEYNYQDGADGGITGPLGDVYLYAHTQLDAQATYGMPRGFQVVVSLLNLNNEVFGFYQGSKAYQIQREFYNRTVSVGVRMTR